MTTITSAAPLDHPAAHGRRLRPDLLFSIRVADAIRAQGGVPDMVESGSALWAAIERWPVLVLIDLAAPDDWYAVVQRAKNLPHTRRIPIVAFGSHVDTATLKAARQAGVDHAWARSHFVTQLPALVQSYLVKPPHYVVGWDDTPSPLALDGFAAFNAGTIGNSTNCWSTRGMRSAPGARAYQGILQVGVALHQIENGRWAGAIKLMRRGLNRLDPLPALHGVDLESFRRQAYIVHQQPLELGAERLGEIDRCEFPQIVLTAPITPVGSTVGRVGFCAVSDTV
ncbi:MAG: DUF309 domain-containing protein [Anaerolineae bacterium]|nr:MAG: DUF309 domain-containing protein [Anaerolineae bacterium]